MKSSHGFASSSPCTLVAFLLLGTLPQIACDQSNSVGKVGDASAGAGGSAGGGDGGASGGITASGAAGSVVGGTTTPGVGGSEGSGKGGGATSGQAGAGGGGKAGASGGSAVDAGVDRYQCPLTNIYCPDGYTTDSYGCTVCIPVGTGGSATGGTSANGGAGGTRADAAADAFKCPSQYINCTNYTYDANGCKVCDFYGTGGSPGGTSGKGGTGGTGAGGGAGSSGAAGSSGTGKVCQRYSEGDATCRSQNHPPQAYFCQVPARPTSTACVIYNGIDSGSYYCCPDQYLTCPDSPPTDATACTGTMTCTYGSHPDPTCRTSASCANGTWGVTAPPSRCSDPQLPATCPAAPVTGTACSSHGLNCAYADGSFCTCNTCTVEDPVCNSSAADKWRCWTPPGGDCPTYYPNLGTICSLPANTRCRYTCASNTTCSAAGVWINGGVLCPVCNSPDTPIATPEGNRPIASLVPGDLVYSINRGQVEVVPIAEVGRRAQSNHRVVRLELATGVVLEISPRHPTADGRTLGTLAAGDRIDGVRVLSAVLVPYRHSHTYDILPASDTGTYYAGGVLIGSTMASEPRPALVTAPACTEAGSR